ncbi:MAG: response regulator [Candidatus Aminicenantes bacterium]|nr:response regulator [Candidatus Aminicenantes bacterium]
MDTKRIVVVDDDESIRKTFFLILSRKYLVYLARDAKEALARFRAAEVDLIIADFKLPRTNGIGNGLEMIAEFRQAGYRGKIILISAFPDLIRLEEVRNLAISDFFVKPLDLQAFNRCIDGLLESEPQTGRSV